MRDGNDREPPDHLAEVRRHGPGDQAAPVVPDYHRVRLAERPDQPGGVGRRGHQVVAARRLVTAAEAAQVSSDSAVSGLAQRGQLLAPGPPELGKTVQQQHQRPLAALCDVKAGPVGADAAVRPGAIDIDRIVAPRGHSDHSAPAREPTAGVPPSRRSRERSSETVSRVFFSPLSPRNFSAPISTARPASRTQIPATIKNAAHGQMPSEIRPKAREKQASMSTRQATKAAMTSSAPAMPSRRASALSSSFARSSSYLISWVTSLTASETRTPRD